MSSRFPVLEVRRRKLLLLDQKCTVDFSWSSTVVSCLRFYGQSLLYVIEFSLSLLEDTNCKQDVRNSGTKREGMNRRLKAVGKKYEFQLTLEVVEIGVLKRNENTVCVKRLTIMSAHTLTRLLGSQTPKHNIEVDY